VYAVELHCHTVHRLEGFLVDPGSPQADVGLALLSGFGNANVDAKNQEVLVWGVMA